MPLAGGGVVDGDVAGLSGPLDDQPPAVGVLQLLALPVEEPEEWLLVVGELVPGLVGEGALRRVDVQGEAVCLQADVQLSQLLEQGLGVQSVNLSRSSAPLAAPCRGSLVSLCACRRAPFSEG